MDEHYPVMLEEVLRYLDPKPEGVWVDCTAGLGSHSRALAEKLAGGGSLISLDRDAESLEKARENLGAFGDRICFRQSRFSDFSATMKELGVSQVKGMLIDAGVSRYQLTAPERGFSLMNDGALDMRMDRSQELTAADVVNRMPERDLANLIFEYSNERRSRKLANAIVRSRPVQSTLGLARVIERVSGPSRIHPATRVFQSLRMYVNSELEELEAILEQAPAFLAGGGRLVTISFHSLEDRICKQKMQGWARANMASLLTKKVVKPQAEEVMRNAASRSSKLRAVQFD
jgi:16S rRNA (cytosine1402-N4)-methyltransferase